MRFSFATSSWWPLTTAFSFLVFFCKCLITSCIRGKIKTSNRQRILAEELSCLTRVKLYISLVVQHALPDIVLARGSTRGVHAGCGCGVLRRTIQQVPPRSPTCSRKNSKKCTTGLRCSKNKYSFPCIQLSLMSTLVCAL
jgi:hypothetical protein